ncbi:hypothetical protein NYR55_05145 [Sphingomonas sp. BGYR3]|uniref:hypothetical protein n=1 Tax=Sphingomonas sp. BGYR3 TaxID=2975483 RepID=UPI0021A2B2E1|nr:hypothetical protein [Sphingomonas sp. BGYR3]MDG5488006.1 hypothetical protein [Sphingomonas sp. BGYR3]
MPIKNRMIRKIAVALLFSGLTVLVWRIGVAQGWFPDENNCTADRQEERDAQGKVTRIVRKTCYSG